MTPAQRATAAKYGKPVLVMAHRGIPVRFPENTMRSFREATALDIDIIEFDVRSSADGRLIVIHDPAVDRTTNGKGTVHEKTFALLSELDAGSWKDASFSGERIPTLDETYGLFKPLTNIMMNVEIKSADEYTARGAIEMAKQYGIIERCVFTSFDARLLAYMRSLDKRVRTQGFPRHCMSNFTDDSFSSMDIVGIPAGCATYELMCWYADHKIEHGVWCIDDAKNAVAMAERGACIITSNDPLVVIDALKAGGYR
ncbi:MAG: glycerophosphodiester phosphodiesterase family protein [Spirochaetota bacterium]